MYRLATVPAHGGEAVLDSLGAGTVLPWLERPALPTEPRPSPDHSQGTADPAPARSIRTAVRLARERLDFRLVPALLILGAHVLVIAVMSMSQFRVQTGEPLQPLQVRMIEEPRTYQPPPAPPAPAVVAAPQMISVPAPVVLMEEPVYAPPQAAAAPVATSGPKAAPPSASSTSTLLSPPRFDADYLSNPPPAYPVVSRRLREEGTVLLRVLVAKNGLAAQVLIEQSSGAVRLDQAARSTVAQWRFVPARTADGPIEEWVLVPIEFSLRK